MDEVAERDEKIVVIEQDLKENHRSDEEFDEFAAKIAAKNKARGVGVEKDEGVEDVGDTVEVAPSVEESQPAMLRGVLAAIRDKTEGMKEVFVDGSDDGEPWMAEADDGLTQEERLALSDLEAKFAAPNVTKESRADGDFGEEVVDDAQIIDGGLKLRARLAIAKYEKEKEGDGLFTEVFSRGQDGSDEIVMAGLDTFNSQLALARQDLESNGVEDDSDALGDVAKNELAFLDEIDASVPWKVVIEPEKPAQVNTMLSLKERLAAVKAGGGVEVAAKSASTQEVQSFSDRLAAIKARSNGIVQEVGAGDISLEEGAEVRRPSPIPVANKDVHPGSSVLHPSLSNRLAALGVDTTLGG